MGEGEGLRDLYHGCYRRLVGQLFAVCGNLGEAEDAVQEALEIGRASCRERVCHNV